MTEEIWRRLEAYDAGWLDSLAGPVRPEEVDAASTELGIPFPSDYREFLVRYGGGMVGAYPIFGLRISRAMALETRSTVIEETRRHRDQQWPGIENCLIISSIHDGNPFHHGNPTGLTSDGKVWLLDADSGAQDTECEDFEAFLNLLLDTNSGIGRWYPVNNDIAARPVLPEPSLELFALSEASRYDIWDRPVMVQTLWSETREEQVLLWPLDEPDEQQDERKPNWRIEVRLPWVRDAVPKVTTRGTLKSLDPDSPGAKLAHAVLVICKQVDGMHGGIGVPTIIRASETSEGYDAMFESLPWVPGRHTSYELTRDLMHYRIWPGR